MVYQQLETCQGAVAQMIKPVVDAPAHFRKNFFHCDGQCSRIQRFSGVVRLVKQQLCTTLAVKAPASDKVAH